MSLTTTPSGELVQMACCLCGIAMTPNDANMCLSCLKDRVDVTEGISRSEVLWSCGSCGRVKSGGDGRWLKCAPESAELLALCLKSVHGLGKGKGKSLKGGAKFVDANWIWTEPHSKRLKVKVTVEKEVFNQAMVRQTMQVEFVLKSRLCEYCVKETTDQNWTTIVQVRQQVKYKRTLLNLENRLVRDGAAGKAMNIVPVATGIDFYFANKNLATKFSDHVLSCVPARRKESKKLQGSDLKSNKYNFRHTINVEVVPVCKHDFIILPLKLQNALFGGKCAAVLCESITRHVNLVDPFTMQRTKLPEAKFWPNSFRAIASGREMIEFSVLDVQPLDYANSTMLAEVEVARSCDLGVNDERFLVTSHIGGFLSPGDTVLGYDFVTRYFGDDVLAPLKGKELPSIVLVQKVNERKKERKDTVSEKAAKKKKPKKSKKKKGPSKDYRNQADDGTASVADSSVFGTEEESMYLGSENEDFDVSDEEADVLQTVQEEELQGDEDGVDADAKEQVFGYESEIEEETTFDADANEELFGNESEIEETGFDTQGQGEDQELEQEVADLDHQTN